MKKITAGRIMCGILSILFGAMVFISAFYMGLIGSGSERHFYKTWFLSASILGFIIVLCYIISGLGILRAKKWARKLQFYILIPYYLFMLFLLSVSLSLSYFFKPSIIIFIPAIFYTIMPLLFIFILTRSNIKEQFK